MANIFSTKVRRKWRSRISKGPSSAAPRVAPLSARNCALDDGLAQAARAKMFRGADDGLVEVRVLKQSHGACAPSLAIAASKSARREFRNRTARADSTPSSAWRAGAAAGRAAGQ